VHLVAAAARRPPEQPRDSGSLTEQKGKDRSGVAAERKTENSLATKNTQLGPQLFHQITPVKGNNSLCSLFILSVNFAFCKRGESATEENFP
jgi:hypothetical protein